MHFPDCTSDADISSEFANYYRPISLTCVISKVFEALILNICKDNLETDELQFTFKQGIGCMDVIFSVKTVVDYFVERGSSVYAATLDLYKHCW